MACSLWPGRPGCRVKTVRYYSDIAWCPRRPVGFRIPAYERRRGAQAGLCRRAREFGFSVEECRELLGLYEDRHRSSADVKRIATRRLDEIAEKQRELQSLHDELAHLVEACRGDHRPDCPIIDGLGARHALASE